MAKKEIGQTGFAQEVNSTGAIGQVVYDDSKMKYQIANLAGRLDDIEQFRNSESVENKIRSISEEFDNLVSTVNGIKKDIMAKIEKKINDEIKLKVKDEVQKLMEKITK